MSNKAYVLRMDRKGLVIVTWSVVIILAAILLGAGCATGPTREAYQGSAAGAAVGAAAGAMLDSDNSWRGGVIGGALGAVLSGALGEISSSRAACEAAYHDRPVAYTNQSSNRRAVAQLKSRQGNCQVITEKYYENGELMKATEHQICNE